MIDGTALGAVLTFIGIAFTSLVGAYVAINTNKTEKKGTAEAALDAKQLKLDERAEEINAGLLRLRDEEIAQLKRQLNECRIELEQEREEDA